VKVVVQQAKVRRVKKPPLKRGVDSNSRKKFGSKIVVSFAVALALCILIATGAISCFFFIPGRSIKGEVVVLQSIESVGATKSGLVRSRVIPPEARGGSKKGTGQSVLRKPPAEYPPDLASPETSFFRERASNALGGVPSSGDTLAH